MNLDDLKRRAAETAARMMSNDTVRHAVEVAIDTGREVAKEAKALGDEVRRQIDAGRPVDDDTAALKERLDRLREEAQAPSEEDPA